MERRTSLSIFIPAATAICALGAAQQTPHSLEARRLTPGTEIRNGGTYHLATGTWTRGSTAAALGNDVVYRNDARPFIIDVASGDVIVDEGELPALDAPTGAPGPNRSEYVINGFTTAYCTGDVRTDLAFTFKWYEAYEPCMDPATLGLGGPQAEIELDGILPGSSATDVFSCWIVTLDLSDTTAGFTMLGSQDGTHDSSSATDSFGWSVEIDYPDGGAVPTSLFSAGDPNVVPFGDGTYYQSPGAATGSGYGTRDSFFGQGPSFPPPMTCFDLGGYGPGTPFASFWMTMYSDENSVHDFVRICGRDTVASGHGLKGRMLLETQSTSGALLGFDRSIAANTSGGNRLIMIAKDLPGPGNGGVTNIGYFIMGTGQNTFVPFGSAGPICIAPGIQRFLPPVNMTNETIVFHDARTGAPTTLVGGGFSRVALGAGAHPIGNHITPGTRWSFQAWHRDASGLSNLTDALCVDFVP